MISFYVKMKHYYVNNNYYNKLINHNSTGNGLIRIKIIFSHIYVFINMKVK